MLCSFRRGANECCIHGLGHRPGRNRNDLAIDVGINQFFHFGEFFFNWWLTIWQFGGGLGKQKLASNSAVSFLDPYDGV